MTAIGELRHRVTIQTLVLTADGIGGHTQAWNTFATVWASIDPVSEAEKLFAQRLETDYTHKIRIRKLAGITHTMRVQFGSRIFQIKGIRADLERKDFMTVTAVENVGT